MLKDIPPWKRRLSNELFNTVPFFLLRVMQQKDKVSAHMLKQEIFQLEMRKRISIRRVVQRWDRLLREIAECPLLGCSKAEP